MCTGTHDLDDEIYDRVQCQVRPVFAHVEQMCTGAHRQTACVVGSCVQLVEPCVQLVEPCVQVVESHYQMLVPHMTK